MAKSSSNSSENLTKKPPGRAQIPEKCRKCAMLTMPDVHALHGAEGDGCYNPKVCRSRRSHARKSEQNNYKRRLQHKQNKRQFRQGQLTGSITIVTTEEIHPPLFVELPTAVAQRYYAILLLYREPSYRGRVHAIRVQIWQGSQLVNEVEGEHCIGMTPTDVIQYVEAMLVLLKQTYKIPHFAAIEQLDPDYCPIRPCPRHSRLAQFPR